MLPTRRIRLMLNGKAAISREYEETMFNELIQAQAAFYTPPANKQHDEFAVTRPFNAALDAIDQTWVDIADDLEEYVGGAIYDAVGRNYSNAEPLDVIRAYARLVIAEVFQRYCHGSRAELREQRIAMRRALFAAYHRSLGKDANLQPGRPRQYEQPAARVEMKLPVSLMSAVDEARMSHHQTRTAWIETAIREKLAREK